MSSTVIQINPDILGGVPCFAGTRVPVKAMFDYLERGDPLADFFVDFPSVQPALVRTLLEEAHSSPMSIRNL